MRKIMGGKLKKSASKYFWSLLEKRLSQKLSYAKKMV